VEVGRVHVEPRPTQKNTAVSRGPVVPTVAWQSASGKASKERTLLSASPPAFTADPEAISRGGSDVMKHIDGL